MTTLVTDYSERMRAAAGQVQNLTNQVSVNGRGPRVYVANATERWDQFLRECKDGPARPFGVGAVDLAALWACFPPVMRYSTRVISDRLMLALYEGDSFARRAARVMVSESDALRVGMFDTLLSVEDKYVGMLALLEALGAHEPSSEFDKRTLGDTLSASLGCVAKLVTTYGNDHYAMSLLASFTEKEAASGVTRREIVLHRYEHVERTVAAMLRGRIQ